MTIFSEMFSLKEIFMEQEIEKKIWDYIDGNCSEAENLVVFTYISELPDWNSKYQELKSIHDLLRVEELEIPSLRFTKNVMEEIANYQVAPATKNYINRNVIRGISGFFLVLIVGLFVYFIGQIHWSGQSTGIFIPSYLTEANKLNWGRMLNNSYVDIFIGISAMLGLILTDKYLQTKKEQSVRDR
jgi:hypothetical protein